MGRTALARAAVGGRRDVVEIPLQQTDSKAESAGTVGSNTALVDCAEGE